MRPPVLIVLHGELSTPGRVAIQLRNRGIPLDVRRPRFGDELPEDARRAQPAPSFSAGRRAPTTTTRSSGARSTGSACRSRRRSRFSASASARRCWRKQLGARVYKHADGHAEVGYYPIRPTAAGRAVCKDWPDHVYQWHREGFDLPDKAVMLAEGDSFPVQAFSYGGAAYALQFHMDVTHATMCRWTTRGHERMALPNAKPRETHFEGRLMHDPACRAWLSEFIDHWLKPPTRPRPTEGGRPRRPDRAPKPARANGGGGQRRAVSRVSTR